MKTHVTLHGELADAIGKAEWEFEIDRPNEALQAIEVNSGGKLLKYFFANMQKEYRIVLDGSDSGADELTMQFSQLREMHVMPVIQGSGNTGMWMGIIGLVIIGIVLAIPTAGGSLFGATSGIGALTSSTVALTATQSFFLTLGVTLTLAGVSQMLAPNAPKESERPENQPSYIFNGAVNTYRQGNPVPIGFGVFYVGSQVISAGINAVDILAAPAATLPDFVKSSTLVTP